MNNWYKKIKDQYMQSLDSEELPRIYSILNEKAGKYEFGGYIFSPFPYVSPRTNPLLNLVDNNYKNKKIPDSILSDYYVRKISYGLKDASDDMAMDIAAVYMSEMNIIDSSSYLVPVPSSKGTTEANMALANRIAKLTGAQVLDVATRSQQAKPLHQRRKEHGISDPKSIQHYMEVKDDSDLNIPPEAKVFLVDNVVTSGSTMDAVKEELNKQIPNSIYGITFSNAS